MGQWIHVAVIAASAGCVSTLLLVFIWRWCHHHKGEHRNFVEPANLTRMESLQQHQPKITNHQFDQRSKIKGNYGRTHLFSWADHPYLAADAEENGWSRFAFTNYRSYMWSSSKRSTLLGACGAAAGDNGSRETEAEIISWQMCEGSDEFMQKIRLNPGLKKIVHPNNPSVSVASVIRTSLPLPGPPLGNYAFPQEAYFEITILYSRGDGSDYSVRKRREGEKTKLLTQEDNSNAEVSSEALALAHVNKTNNVEEMKLGKESRKIFKESVMFSLGLTAEGDDVPLRVPGSYPGSIGFNSNGSVFLDGMELVMESENEEWVGTDKVIGCGFDPRQKKVFFTLDSQLVHVIYCQSQEFGNPLCPTLAANIDIVVLVNFGQRAFKYAPANAQRTRNPYFIAPPLVNCTAATLGKELFSMGRIDSQRLNRSKTKGSLNNNENYNHRTLDFDEESEADLFEIILDGSGSGKSPNTVS